MTSVQLTALLDAFAEDVAVYARTGVYGDAAHRWLWWTDESPRACEAKP
jgi:hypothetical protein